MSASRVNVGAQRAQATDADVQAVTVHLSDDFSDPQESGSVIGSLTANGHQRQGVDVEGVMSIDNGALRIAPLVETGFGRAALCYGPFAARPGLVYAVYMLNGHNTAQAEPLPDTFLQRVGLWFKGARIEGRWSRLVTVLTSARTARFLRHFKRWRRSAKGGRPVTLLDENLALGWFPSAVPEDPRACGSPFVMHALGPENGEVWTGAKSNRTRALRGVQNVPIYYVAVLRAQGTVYYTASLEDAIGPGSYPHLRPIAVDRGPESTEVFLGIHQSVLGQIGWRLDSRVQGVRVAQIQGYESWCGGAHAADLLAHGQPSAAEGWSLSADSISSTGVQLAVLDPGAPSGMVLVSLTGLEQNREAVGLIWRFENAGNHWRIVLRGDICELGCVVDGRYEVLASRPLAGNPADRRLQVLDDGQRLMAYMDGEPLLDRWIRDTRFAAATKVGVLFNDRGAQVGVPQRFEAHPRQIEIPEILDMGAPWVRKGTSVVVEDQFVGEVGDLEGRVTQVGNRVWRRVIGTGTFEVTGNGSVRVKATPQARCPSRTAYCIDWLDPNFIDIETTITPPGSTRGQGHLTTAGFILYQDDDNYMTLNCYRGDYYGGGSISTFFKFDGYEDIYDAIWSNVGDRVYYGRPLRLRLCCDGQRYLVFINDEAVLFRAFRDVYPDVKPLAINKVGLLANWEFGTDTGSAFEHCVLRV